MRGKYKNKETFLAKTYKLLRQQKIILNIKKHFFFSFKFV